MSISVSASSPEAALNIHQHLIVPQRPSSNWTCLEHSVVQPFFLHTLGMPFPACWWLFYLLIGDFTAFETPQAGEGGLDCILCPWRAGCWQLGPKHHGEGFWGMHLLQEVLYPSKTSAFKRRRLHIFRKEIALCREAQKMFRKLVTVGDPNFSTGSCRRWQRLGIIPIKRTNRWWGTECRSMRSGKQVLAGRSCGWGGWLSWVWRIVPSSALEQM